MKKVTSAWKIKWFAAAEHEDENESLEITHTATLYFHEIEKTTWLSLIIGHFPQEEKIRHGTKKIKKDDSLNNLLC